MEKKRKLWLIISIVIVAILVIGSISIYAISSAIKKAKTSTIETYTIPATAKVFINGIISPAESESIYLDASKGTLNKCYVSDGQTVKKGDKLFDYKNQTITDQIDQLNIQLNGFSKQKSQLISDKNKAIATSNTVANSLVTDGSSTTNTAAVSQNDVSGYDAQIATVEQQISSSQQQIDSLKKKEYSQELAPIDGIVTLSENQKITDTPYIIIQSKDYYVDASINEKDQPKLKVNQVADVLIFSTNKTVTGKIQSIGDRPLVASANGAAQNGISGASSLSYYSVKIGLDSQDGLTNGFHVQAIVKLEDSGIKIPKSSILKDNDTAYVYKVVNNKTVKQTITYSESNSDSVTITSGLSEKDQIVKKPTSTMKEGMFVG